MALAWCDAPMCSNILALSTEQLDLILSGLALSEDVIAGLMPRIRTFQCILIGMIVAGCAQSCAARPPYCCQRGGRDAVNEP